MKAQPIFQNAKISARVYGNTSYLTKNGYNPSFMLSHEHIRASALLQIRDKLKISLEDAGKEYSFFDITLQEQLGEIDLTAHNPSIPTDESLGLGYEEETNPIEEVLSKEIKEVINSASGVVSTDEIIEPIAELSSENIIAIYGDTFGQAITAAKLGNPSFISFDNGAHFTLIALVPSYIDHNSVSVVYVNSMPKVAKEDVGSLLSSSLKLTLEELAMLEKDTEVDCTRTGKNCAKAIVDYINEGDKEVQLVAIGEEVEEGYIDASKDQQYANCCGLSVASNIASIAEHCANGKAINAIKDSLFTPKDEQEKLFYYRKLGNQLFQTLDNKYLRFDTIPINWEKYGKTPLVCGTILTLTAFSYLALGVTLGAAFAGSALITGVTLFAANRGYSLVVNPINYINSKIEGCFAQPTTSKCIKKVEELSLISKPIKEQTQEQTKKEVHPITSTRYSSSGYMDSLLDYPYLAGSALVAVNTMIASCSNFYLAAGAYFVVNTAVAYKLDSLPQGLTNIIDKIISPQKFTDYLFHKKSSSISGMDR